MEKANGNNGRVALTHRKASVGAVRGSVAPEQAVLTKPRPTKKLFDQ
jgi:hypothetical protein